MGLIGTLGRWTAGVAGLTVATAAGLLFVYQSALVYPASFPEGSRTMVDTPDMYKMPFTEHRILTPDRVALHVYAMVHDDDASRPTVLMFHANAGNMGHRLPIAQQFYRRMGCHVVMLSYRGYGLSTGHPTEMGLRIDAQTLLDWVLAHPKLSRTQLVVYGQSIGGAVAIDLAARNPRTVGGDALTQIRGVVVENTFLSIPALVPTVLPMLRPFLFLCREVWPSHVSVAKVRKDKPMLFLSATNDELIPAAHMKELYRLATSEHKEFHAFATGTHSTSRVSPQTTPGSRYGAALMQKTYFDTIALFLRKYDFYEPAATDVATSDADIAARA